MLRGDLPRPRRRFGRRRTEAGAEEAPGPSRGAPAHRSDLEREADHRAEALASEVGETGAVGPGPVPATVREPVERWAGVDLSDVRIDTAAPSDARALAATEGSRILIGSRGAEAATPFGRHVLVHELVHAAQQRQLSDRPSGPRRARHGTPQFFWCEDKQENAAKKLRSGTPISAKEAEDILSAYGSGSEAEKESMVAEFHKLGQADSALQRLLAALPPDRHDAHRETLRDLLARVQAHATRAAAGKTHEELAKTQGKWMEDRAQAAAKQRAEEEAKAKGAPPPAAPPTKEEVGKAHERQVEKVSLPSPGLSKWAEIVKDPKQKKVWDDLASTKIDEIVAEVNRVRPDMAVTRNNFKWDPAAIENRAGRIFAMTSGPVMTVGLDFIEAAKHNVGYVVRTVIHELRGHPEFGIGDTYEWTIYRSSTAHFPSYAKPASDKKERDIYDYLGTEIYSALRELPYEVPIAKEHVGKFDGAIKPADNVKGRVAAIASEFEPGVAKAILRGLYERFRIDPRLTPAALKLYVDTVHTHFPKLLTP